MTRAVAPRRFLASHAGTIRGHVPQARTGWAGASGAAQQHGARARLMTGRSIGRVRSAPRAASRMRRPAIAA
jgi:hypothetical protein